MNDFRNHSIWFVCTADFLIPATVVVTWLYVHMAETEYLMY